MKLEVGTPYLPVAGRPEGAIFDIDSAGARLIYHFRRPTQQEISAVKAGQKFEIRFAELDGIIWVLSKCGSLNWTDAPYDPHLSLLTGDFPEILGENEGLALTLMITDADTAEIKSLRMIGLGHRFSVSLLSRAKALRETPFSLERYQNSLRATMAKYTTKQLVDLSTDYFKLK